MEKKPINTYIPDIEKDLDFKKHKTKEALE